ncbi:Putative transposase of IS4/5 family [Streptomyces sp. SolWspMP-5a-2]|nr:Putative transposase of IS4/5 family [Streptomyces sp. SolWspMP-5a-2]
MRWRFRTGAPWRDLSQRYGSWKTVYERHCRWSADGIWDRILHSVQADADLAGRVDGSMAGVDSTSCRAHQHAAGARKAKPRVQKKGRRPGTTAPTRDSDGPGPP